MIVYCVMESVLGAGSFLVSIWSTEEYAQDEIDRLNECYPGRDLFIDEETILK